MTKKKKYDVHLITHTHWDREWYQSFEIYRFRLFEVFERLKFIFKEQDNYHSFFFDGQTAPLEDFIEARPDDKKEIIDWIRRRRLRIGPFYILHDEQLTCAEAQVRNLIIGLDMVKQYDAYAPIGYVPDNFGHISQTPQILAGFGLDNAVMWRGYKVDETTPTEAVWLGADGTKIKTVMLICGYSSAAGMNFPDTGSFERALENFVDLKKRSECGTFLIMNGVDHALPTTDIVANIAFLEEKFPDCHIRHSSLDEFIKEIPWDKVPELLHGELLHAPMLDGTFSSRMNLKIMNRLAENELSAYAEPMSAIAYLQTKKYPAMDLKRAWKYLLKCHPHDSITGCHTDRVTEDIIIRLKRAYEMGDFLAKTAWDAVIGEVYDYQIPADSKIISVFNPLSSSRQSVIRTDIYVHSDLDTIKTILIKTPSSAVLQANIVKQDVSPIVFPLRSDYMIPLSKSCKRITVEFGSVELKPLGFTDFEFEIICNEEPADNLMTAVTVSGKSALNESKMIAHSNNILENEFIKVKINRDATVDVSDKKSGEEYLGLHQMEVIQDAGNLYMHRPLQQNTCYYLNPVNFVLKENFDTSATFSVSGYMRLPEGLDHEFTALQRQLDCPVTVNFTLKKNDPVLYISSSFDNRVKNVCWYTRFCTGFENGKNSVHTPFDIVERSPLNNSDVVYSENTRLSMQISRYCAQCFTSFSENRKHLTLLNKGLPEYTFESNGDATLTLLRSSNIIWGTSPRDFPNNEFPAESAFEIGEHKREYGLLFHSNSITDNLTSAIGFNLSPEARLYQHSVKTDFNLSLAPSFLVLSAFKQAEDGNGLILRFYNVLNEETEALIDTTCIFTRVTKVELNETDKDDSTAIEMNDGIIKLKVKAKEIISLRLTNT